MKNRNYFYCIIVIILGCSSDAPSPDKVRCLEILKAINSEEIELLNNFSNQEIAAFKIRPNHDIIFSLGTIVHEANHKYHDIDNKSKIAFRLNSDYKIILDRYEIFESKDLTLSMPIKHIETFKKNHRYKLYIADTEGISNMSTQVNGLYGLLDEYNSYYQDMKTVIGLYTYLKTEYVCTDSHIWVDYLGLYDSTMNSMSEFRYFLITYLTHAENNHLSLYNQLISNTSFINMIKYLEDEELKILKEYFEIQNEIITNCSNDIELTNNKISDKNSELGYIITLGNDRTSNLYKLISEIDTRDNMR